MHGRRLCFIALQVDARLHSDHIDARLFLRPLKRVAYVFPSKSQSLP